MSAPQPTTVTRYYPDREVHPLEHEVVTLVESCLTSQRWPFERIPCRVSFDLRPGCPSRSMLKISARNGQGLQVGRVEAWFNLSYLHQNPGLFLNDIVPHESAHLLAEAEAEKKGNRIPAHGDEWKAWLARLSATATPKGYGWRGAFDDRPCLLAAGGVPHACMCAGDERYQFFPLRNGPPAENCDRCKQPFRHVPREQVPPGMQREVDALVAWAADKHLYGWLD